MKTRSLISAMILIAAAVAVSHGADIVSLGQFGNLQAGSVLILTLKGDASAGSFWGTDLYAIESNLQAAAVHAGALAQGQTGTVVVIVREGAKSFAGTQRNGAASLSIGASALGFSFAGALGALPAARPGSASAPSRICVFEEWEAIRQVKPVPGISVYARVKGSTAGSVWGTDSYTIDSSLPLAAVHAGILQPGQTGLVRVTFEAGRDKYEGSQRNGANTMSYGSYPAGYRVEAVTGNPQTVAMIPSPRQARQFPSAAPGSSFVIWVTGTENEGSVWGSDFYTADSLISDAAVHMGLLRAGESGPLLIRLLAGIQEYKAETRNGIASKAYSYYDPCFTLEAVR